MLNNQDSIMQVNLYDAKTRLSELVDAAHEGQVITIGKAGKAMARLVPIAAPRRRIRIGLMKGRIRIGKDFDAPLPDELIRAFEGSNGP